jgi:hypothetical protein
MDLKEIGVNPRDWVDLAQHRNFWERFQSHGVELVNRRTNAIRKLHKLTQNSRCINI